MDSSWYCWLVRIGPWGFSGGGGGGGCGGSLLSVGGNGQSYGALDGMVHSRAGSSHCSAISPGRSSRVIAERALQPASNGARVMICLPCGSDPEAPHPIPTALAGIHQHYAAQSLLTGVQRQLRLRAIGQLINFRRLAPRLAIATITQADAADTAISEAGGANTAGCGFSREMQLVLKPRCPAINWRYCLVNGVARDGGTIDEASLDLLQQELEDTFQRGDCLSVEADGWPEIIFYESAAGVHPGTLRQGVHSGTYAQLRCNHVNSFRRWQLIAVFATSSFQPTLQTDTCLIKPLRMLIMLPSGVDCTVGAALREAVVDGRAPVALQVLQLAIPKLAITHSCWVSRSPNCTARSSID